jgi:Uma2 family endonuclease
MKPVIKTRPFSTVRDYMALPTEHGVELIEGDLVMSPSPDASHQRLVRKLVVALDGYLKRKPIGEVFPSPMDVILSLHTVLQPDLVVVLRGRASVVKDRIRGAPDLAIEILSAATSERDRLLKRELYARHGVREYWIVDPDARTIEVYSGRGRRFGAPRIFEKGDRLSTPLLKDLRLALKELWG